MTGLFIIVMALLTALALIIGAVRFSMWMTDRKSASTFKNDRSDASSINDGGFMF